MVDLVLNFPFGEDEGGFAGAFGPKVKSEPLEKAVKRALFERKPDDFGHPRKCTSTLDRKAEKRIKESFTLKEIHAFQICLKLINFRSALLNILE